jgi:hypothetical protein
MFDVLQKVWNSIWWRNSKFLLRSVKLAFCWLWLVFLSVSLCFSLYFLSMAYAEERESKLKDYEKGVETWNEEVRPVFSNLTITAFVSDTPTYTNATKFTHVLQGIEQEIDTIEQKLDHDGYG